MMKNRVRNTITYKKLIDRRRHEHIVLGLSGGPDSLCLFHVLLQLQMELNITIHPVHVTINSDLSQQKKIRRMWRNFVPGMGWNVQRLFMTAIQLQRNRESAERKPEGTLDMKLSIKWEDELWKKTGLTLIGLK